MDLGGKLLLLQTVEKQILQLLGFTRLVKPHRDCCQNLMHMIAVILIRELHSHARDTQTR